MCSSASGKAYVHEWVCVTFRNTPKLILTNPNCPQCYGTQSASCLTPTKHWTHVGDPPDFEVILPVPQTARMTWRTPDWTPIACPGIVAVKTLGTNYPCPASWASVPISASGIETWPRSHRNPNSVLHIVIIPHCCSLPDPESVILVCTLDHLPLHPHTPQCSTMTPVYKDPPFY